MPAAFMRYRRSAVATLLLLVLLSTALRPSFKYLFSIWPWVLYAAAAVGIIVALVLSRKLLEIVTSKVFVFGIASLFAGLSIFFYPLADALERQMQGQDQDDCTILVAQQLLAFDFPYDQTSYFGNPCSPLFGAVLPYIPFIALGVFGIANAVFVLAFLFSAWRYSSESHAIGLAVLISLAIPHTLELLVNGSDFIFMGFGLLLLAILMKNSFSSPKLLVGATILAAVLSSTRVSMPILAMSYLIWLFLNLESWRLVFHSTLLILVSVLPSFLVFLWSPGEFSPLHLVAKGQRLVPGGFYLLMIAATLLGLVVAVLMKRVRENPELYLALGVAPHLIFLSYGDLIFNRKLDLFWWEGANYLMVVTPLFAYIISRRILEASKLLHGQSHHESKG